MDTAVNRPVQFLEVEMFIEPVHLQVTARLQVEGIVILPGKSNGLFD